MRLPWQQFMKTFVKVSARINTRPTVLYSLLGTKPLSKPMRVIVNWTLRNKLQWNWNRNTKFFINEIAFENVVCEMAAILFRGSWINSIGRCGNVHQIWLITPGFISSACTYFNYVEQTIVWAWAWIMHMNNHADWLLYETVPQWSFHSL